MRYFIHHMLTPESVRSSLALYARWLRWARACPPRWLQQRMRRNVQEAFRFRQEYFQALLRDAAESDTADEERVHRVVRTLDAQLQQEARSAVEAMERITRALPPDSAALAWRGAPVR